MLCRASWNLVLGLLWCICAVPALSDTLEIDVGSPKGTIAYAAHSTGRQIVRSLNAPGCGAFTSSGNPTLPCKIIYVALPPDADPSSVRIEEISSTTILPGNCEVLPVPPIATADGLPEWGPGKLIERGRNQKVYTANEFYPPAHLQVVAVGKMRSWKVAALQYWPYCYNPVTGKLRESTSRKVKISFKTQTRTSPTVHDVAAAQMSGFIVNAGEAVGWYAKEGGAAAESISSAPASDYVIITTSAIASSSAELGNFCSLLGLRGFSARVVTESDWGGGLGDAAAENIRGWLTSNYLALGIRYALLIGNPDPSSGDVPMKMLWPRRNQSSYPEAPSDYYYADLNGNWDLDGDSFAGEYPDDFGPGGIDRIPEIYVGRIPVYDENVNQLDSILRKIIDYQSHRLGNWSRRFLLPMKPLDASTQSYQLGENIRRDFILPLDFSPVRIYDQDYGLQPLPERNPCDYAQVRGEWAQGAGLVFWMAHGGPTGADCVMESDKCGYLDNTKPAVVYEASCSNGMPEEPGNLGYALLKQGAICTLSASRASWYYIGEYSFTNSDSIGGLGYQYAKFLLAGRESCGRAIMDARLAVPLFVWPNHLVFNLYGDPSLAFDQPAPGAVSGRIATRSGQAVSGALVRTVDGRIIATTQDDGSFMLRGLSEGVVSFDIYADGFYPQRLYDVSVTCGRLTHVDVTLSSARSGGLCGHVYDEFGYPLAGAVVEVAELARSAQTQECGEYGFESLPPGTYTIKAGKSPYAQFAAECRVAEGTASELNFTLRLRDGNAISNGGFEKGFVNGLGVFWQSYASSGYLGGPAIGSDYARLGTSSQKINLPETASMAWAGIYQTAKVVPGRPYSIIMWQRDHFGGEESHTYDNVICRVGWDLTGGIDPLASTVTWHEFPSGHDVWHSYFKSVSTYAPSVTLFLEGRRKIAGGGDDCCAWFDGVSLTGPVEAPPVPNVLVAFPFQSDRTAIGASWSCGSSDVAAYEYAVSATTTEEGIVTGGEWRNVGTDTSAVRTGLNLPNGALVRVLVRALNASGKPSETGFSAAVRIVNEASGPAAARQFADGTWIGMRDLVVTRVGEPGSCFLETADRASGIKAVGTMRTVPILQPGTVVSVFGRAATDGCMRVLADTELLPTADRVDVRPLVMSNRAVGGASSGYYAGPPARGQLGSVGGTGANNVGLLVTVTGRVIEAAADEFVITDGSLRAGFKVKCFNDVLPPAPEDMVRITGISSPDGVLVFTPEDITVL